MCSLGSAAASGGSTHTTTESLATTYAPLTSILTPAASYLVSTAGLSGSGANVVSPLKPDESGTAMLCHRASLSASPFPSADRWA